MRRVCFAHPFLKLAVVVVSLFFLSGLVLPEARAETRTKPPAKTHSATKKTSKPAKKTARKRPNLSVQKTLSPSAAITLAWDANSEPDLAGYRVHYGTARGNYPNQIEAGNTTTVSVPNLVNGTYFFVVTAYNSAGLEGPASNEVSATVTETWGAVTTLGGVAGYNNMAAAGQIVVAGVSAWGDVTTVQAGVSSNEGATWPALASKGAGALYLDHPIAISGQTVGIASVPMTESISDWCRECGMRDVGDIYVNRSLNGGTTFLGQVRATTGKRAFRLSLAISGSTWHLTWMNWRNEVTPDGTWDVEYTRSTDNGLTWAPARIIGNGTNAMGAERPGIAVVGPKVYVVAMDGRDNQPPCQIEGNHTVPVCTEVYLYLSTDNGVTWAPPRRLTNDVAYSGRPDIAALGSTLGIAYDHRVPGGVDKTGLLVSRDAGASWTQSVLDTVNDGFDQSHAVIVGDVAHGWFVAWGHFHGISYLSATFGLKWSADLVNWSAEETIPGPPGAGVIGLTNNYLHAVWGYDSLVHVRKFIGTGSPTPTPGSPTPAPTPPSCPENTTITGALVAGDSTQSGRLLRIDPVTTCAAPTICEYFNSGSIRRDQYTYRNTSLSASCFTVTLTQVSQTGELVSSAYLGTFDPQNQCATFLGDSGASLPAGTPKSYSVSVPAGANFVVIVTDTKTEPATIDYTLNVTGDCSGLATPTPARTPTPTPQPVTPAPTPTQTPTPTATPAATPTPAETPPPSPTPSEIPGSLVAGDPDFPRPNRFVQGGTCSAASGTRNYDAHELILAAAGPITASLCDGPAWDTYLIVYQAPGGVQIPSFVPNGCVNAIAANDDFCGVRSQVTVNLEAGFYYVVVTAYGTGGGSYLLSVTGGTATPPPTQTPTPIPSATPAPTPCVPCTPCPPR